MIKLKYAIPFIIAGVILLGLVQAVFAQEHEKCASTRYAKNGINDKLYNEQLASFEEWMSEKMAENKVKRTEAGIYTIPIVIHILHGGEPIGTGRNISEEQIMSQIEVLNEDFRRLNRDAANTPSDFQDVAADSEIEFCLAKRDPEGLPTTGINRVNVGDRVFGFNDDRAIKSRSYWPAEDYFNVWVTNLGGGLLGYAQPPQTDLPGWEGFGNFSRTTDGIVVDYEWFGKGTGTARGAGRTTTHEVGHYLSLRHIWGDGRCGFDDFCDDTPESDGANRGCDASHESCGTVDMVQNYMDYTDDFCMNMFTNCQRERMRIVMENSPRRASLLESKACDAPVEADLNAGIRSSNLPSLICAHSYTPEIELRNYGSDALTSVTVGYEKDGVITENFFTWEGNLDRLEVEEVELPEIELEPGRHTIRFFTSAPNGAEDGDPENDDYLIEFLIIDEEPLSLQSFDETIFPPQNWTVNNPDGSYTWRDTVMNDGNNAVAIDLAFYSDRGQRDQLLTPIFDLTSFDKAFLTFRVAYSRMTRDGTPIADNEGLRVQVSNNCGRTFSNVFQKFSDELATYGPNILTEGNSSSSPESDADWRRERVDISRFSGEKVVVSFLSVNDFGNTIFLDDIEITNISAVEEWEEFSRKFTLYPNPSKGQVKLQLTTETREDFEVTVFDALGHEILSRSFKNVLNETHELNLSAQPAGVYLVKIQSNGIYTTKRVVISK